MNLPAISRRLRRMKNEFYSRSTPIVARDLIGKYIVRDDEVSLIGRIVEVEAYGGSEDPASHAARGKTQRNEVMFNKPGTAYVYFIYGNHHCLNVVAHEGSSAGAVLIRALEPISGIEQMKKYRNLSDDLYLTSGPGRLTKAMNINKIFNGIDLLRDKTLSIQMTDESSIKIGTSKRIGIRKGIDREWRFFAIDSRFVSRR